MKFTVGVEAFAELGRLHRHHFLGLPLDVLIRKHLYSILQTQLGISHVQIEYDVFAAFGQTTKQTNSYVLVLYLSTDAADLGPDVENFIAMMQDVVAFRHLHTKELSLEVDSAILLQSGIRQDAPTQPKLFLGIYH